MATSTPCRYGTSCKNKDSFCRYSHPSSSSSGTFSVESPSKYPLNASQASKISTSIPCRFGTACNKKSCTFSHPERERDPLTSSSGSSVSTVSLSGNPNSKLACHYGNGCNRSDCRFAHPGRELLEAAVELPPRSPSKLTSPSSPSSITEKCWFGSNCTNPKCTRSHEAQASSSSYRPPFNSGTVQLTHNLDNKSDSSSQSGSKTPSIASTAISFSERLNRRSSDVSPILQIYNEICDDLCSKDVIYLRSAAKNDDATKIPQICSEATNLPVIAICPDSSSAAYLHYQIAYEFEGISPSKAKKVALHTSATPLALPHLMGSQIVVTTAADLIAKSDHSKWLDHFGIAVVMNTQSRKVEVDLALAFLAHLRIARHTASSPKLILLLLSSDNSDVPLRNYFNLGEPLAVPALPPLPSETPHIESLILLRAEEGGQVSIEEASSHPTSLSSSASTSRHRDSPSTIEEYMLSSINEAVINRVESMLRHTLTGTILVMVGRASHARTLEEMFASSWTNSGSSVTFKTKSLLPTTSFKEINQLRNVTSERLIVFATEWSEWFAHVPNVALVIDSGLTTIHLSNGVVIDTLVPQSTSSRRVNLCRTSNATYLSLYSPHGAKAEPNFVTSELSTYLLQLYRANIKLNYISNPPPSIAQAAEKILLDTGCLIKNVPSHSYLSSLLNLSISPSEALSYSITQFGVDCLKLGQLISDGLLWL